MSTFANYSFPSIFGMYALSFLPHAYAMSIAFTAGSGLTWDNANPRAMHQQLKDKIPKAKYDRFLRAEGANSNGFENLPLWAIAVLAGNMARLPNHTLNSHATVYLVTRAIYNVIYISTESNALSFFRSAVYLAGIGTIGSLMLQAGSVLG